MLAPLLAVLILFAYGASLWWLLRGEKIAPLACIGMLMAVALATRLVWAADYPPGLNEDEAKVLWSAVQYLRFGHFFLQDSTGLPSLLSVLFEAQLAEIIGPTRWAIRSYSLLGSVLSVPAGYAAARSMRLGVVASLVAAGLIAVLPWSLFYGRVHQSGDMVFHELLLLSALGRFVFGSGGIVEVGIGALGLCFLFYGYFSGRALLGLTLIAAVLARGRGRLFCVAVALLALLGWLPFVLWSGSPHLLVGLSAAQTQAGLAEQPLATLAQKAAQALRALAEPVAWDQWLTVRAAAVHPAIVLGLALLGSLTGGRRALLLWAGFLGGMAPAVLGSSPLPSTRRMLMAMPFISLAAAASFDLIPWRRARLALATAFVFGVGFVSVRYYFSTEFWSRDSRLTFDQDRTAVVEALPLPPHPRMIVDKGLGWIFSPRRLYDDTSEPLSVENWYPANGEESIYAFQPRNGPLMEPYREIFGAARIERFGQGFVVRVPAEDWSWMRSYGWTYEVKCGDSLRTGQVPVLFHVETSFRGPVCPDPTVHVWSGRWRGPETRLALTYQGTAKLRRNGTEVELKPAMTFIAAFGAFGQHSSFEVRGGDEVVIELYPPTGLELFAALYELTPSARVPPLQSVEPPALVEP